MNNKVKVSTDTDVYPELSHKTDLRSKYAQRRDVDGYFFTSMMPHQFRESRKREQLRIKKNKRS